MKKFFLTFCLLTLWLSGSFAGNGQLTLTGVLDSLPANANVQLFEWLTGSDDKPVASAQAVDGRFQLTAKSPGIRLYVLRVEGCNGQYNLLMNDEDTQLSGIFRMNGTAGRTYFTIAQPVVNGNALQQEYEQKLSVRNRLDNLYQAKAKQDESLKNIMQEARETQDTAFLRAIKQSKAYEALAQREKVFFDEVGRSYQELVLGNKDSWWGPLLLMTVCNRYEAEQIKWYEQFSPEAKNSVFGKYLKKEMYPEGFKGKSAPAFEVTGKDGKLLASKQLMKGKRYILIDFWASWCGPCRREIPNLKAQYALYAAKGLEIISISTDRNPADWQKALDQEQLPWPNFRDQNGIANLYNVKAIPSIFLIGANGKVIEENLRGEALAAKLKELMP